MNDQLQNQLAQLAEKFGTTVEHLWSVMLRQAYISGVMSLVNIVGIVISIVVYWRYVKWYTGKEKKGEYGFADFMDEVGHPMICGIGGVLLFVVAIIGIPNELYWAITSFTNPEYWALKQILH